MRSAILPVQPSVTLETTAAGRRVPTAEFSPLTGVGQSSRNTSPDQILYTEGVQAHWRETTVGEHGERILEGLPFEPGQPVDVLVVSKAAGSTAARVRSLRDSVLEFREPLKPVASEDWDALQ